MPHHRFHAFGLRIQAQDVHAQRAQLRQLGPKVGGFLALHRDAVDAQERAALAGGQRHAVGMVDAAEAALVLGHVQRARGEAARRVRQRQPAPGGHFQFRHRAAGGDEGLLEFADQRAPLLDAGHPAAHAVLGQHRQRAMVVDVERRSGHERPALLPAQLHRGQVVGLYPEAAVRHLAVKHAQFRLGLDQRQRRQHDLLAGSGQLLGERQPVGGAQFAALAAHGLAQVDHVQRPVDRLAIERQRALARPEVLQRAKADLHRRSFNARRGGTGRAWSGGLRRGAPVRPATRAVPASARDRRRAGRWPCARCA